MSYKVEIVESSSKLVELESSIGDQQPTIEVLKENETSIVITQDVAILPSDFDDKVKTIIDSFLNQGYGISITPSGSFLVISTSGLQPSGNYSLVGHNHISSDITDFSNSVSGLLPVKNITNGSGIAVTNNNGNFTVAVTGQFGLTGEQVDDRVSSLLSSGYGINLNYDDNNNILTISTIGLQPSGNYSLQNHTHNTTDIINFNSAVSGLLQVKNIVAGSNIGVSANSGTYTINSTNEILQYDITANFPLPGNTNILYIATNTSRIYRWTGGEYVEVGATPSYVTITNTDGDSGLILDFSFIDGGSATIFDLYTIDGGSATIFDSFTIDGGLASTT